MVNTANTPRAYSEVYGFINALGEEYINKVPKKIYSIIRNNRDVNYNPIFNASESITTQNISKEALAIISALNLQYWCEEPQEKERLKRVYHQNAKKEEEKYSYENMFQNNKVEAEDVEVQTENVQIIEYKEENIFTKIMNKIRNFFTKLKIQ